MIDKSGKHKKIANPTQYMIHFSDLKVWIWIVSDELEVLW
jgi:hypothetical protein